MTLPSTPRPTRLSDLRGAVRLATDATTGVTDLVEAVHGRVLRPPGLSTPRPDDRTGGLTGAVYRSVRAVQRGVGRGLEGLLGALESAQPPAAPTSGAAAPAGAGSARRDALVAALNGVIGDRLASAQNPLAVPFQLKRRGVALDLGATDPAFGPGDGAQLVVLLHGLCMDDGQWLRKGHDHGAALERDLGLSAVHVRYNSGLAVHENAAHCARALEALLARWPVPVERLVLVGYSMGGLVARSAVHQAMDQGLTWPQRLSDLVFLGTPHHGAPLERIGGWIDGFLGLAPYAAPFARLGRVRSIGITDLRHGRLFGGGDAGHEQRERQAARWPRNTVLHALAASTARDPQGAAGSQPGDGLVPLDSALGRHPQRAQALPIAPERQWVGWTLHHLDLLSDPGVYERLRASLQRPVALPRMA